MLEPAFPIAPVNRRLSGGFVEQMGRGVYSGPYGPDPPRADKDGFRTDVLDRVRELGVTTVRDPQGVVPAPLPVQREQATLTMELPPVAWACVRLCTSTPTTKDDDEEHNHDQAG